MFCPAVPNVAMRPVQVPIPDPEEESSRGMWIVDVGFRAVPSDYDITILSSQQLTMIREQIRMPENAHVLEIIRALATEEGEKK